MKLSINEIDADALPRDRTLIDATALDELKRSILANGLRIPIEVYQTPTGHALISGYRRLMAYRALHAQTELPQFADIPVIIRAPNGTAAALAQMVEENEIRQNPSPWERAHIAHHAVETGIFETLGAALTTLYPQASRQKRAKLRAVAEVVQALDGQLTDPETLTERKLTRIANALRLDWRELIVVALNEVADEPAYTQWKRLSPILAEVEELVKSDRPTCPTRPRRLSTPMNGVAVRREKTKNGYTLHITGPQANGVLIEGVLDQIELWLSESD